MEYAYLFALVACFLGAGGMYVSVEYRLQGERQSATNRLLKAQADAAAVRKEVQGYTKYAEYLAATKAELAEKLKLMLVKVMREYAHSETIAKEPNKIKNEIQMLVRYSVEYTFSLDPKIDQFNLQATPDGVEIQLKKPLLLGFPAIHILSHQLGVEEPMVDQKGVVSEVQVKLPALVRKWGTTIANEEATLAVFEKKLTACVRDFLAAQAGVKLVPAITVTFL